MNIRAMWRRGWPALLLLITIGFHWRITLSKQYYWLDLGACSFAFGRFMAAVIWPQILMSALRLLLILMFLLRVDDGRWPIGSAALAGPSWEWLSSVDIIAFRCLPRFARPLSGPTICWRPINCPCGCAFSRAACSQPVF